MRLAEASLNSKEIKIEDVMEMDATDSFAEAKAVMKTARKRINQFAVEQQQRQIDAEKQMQEQQLQVQIELANADREDRQAAKISEIQEKTKGTIEIDNNRMGKQMVIDTNNIQQKAVADGTMNNLGSPPM